MSFGRWSLPSRANHSTLTPNQLVKFPTVNFSQPRFRRSHASSIFTPTSERDADASPACLSVSKEASLNQEASENIRPTDMSHTGNRLTTSTGHVTDPSSSSTPSRSGFRTPLRLVPGFNGQLRLTEKDVKDVNQEPIDEKKTVQYSDATSASGHVLEQPDLAKPSPPTARIHSSASSYPSEGIRSPNGGSSSPEPTAATRHIVFDLARLGALPDHHPWYSSVASIDSGPNGKNSDATYSPLGSQYLSDSENRAFGSRPSHPLCSASRAADNWGCDHSSTNAARETSPHTMMSTKKMEEDDSSNKASRTDSEGTVRVSPPQAAKTVSLDEVNTAVDTSSRPSLQLQRVSAGPQSLSDTMASVQGIAPDSAIAKSGTTSLEIDPSPQLEKSRVSEASSIPSRGAQRLRLKRWIRRLCQRTRARFGKSPKNNDFSAVLENPASVALERRPRSSRHLRQKASALRFWKCAHVAKNSAKKSYDEKKQSDEGMLLNESGLESRLALMSLGTRQ